MKMERVHAIGARKFASLRRDKQMFGFIVLMPAIQIILFGIAIGQTPYDLDFGVIDESDGALQGVETGLAASHALIIHEYDTVADARADIEEGAIWGALLLTEEGQLELHLDNSNQQVSNTILIEVRNAMEAALAEQGASLPMEIADPVFGERDPSFIDFLAPGIITLVCFMFSTILTTIAFVGERYDGTLDRVFAAGTKPSEVLLGHMGAFSTILIGQVLVVIGIAVFAFDTPVNGNPIILFLLALMLGWAAMCLGLLISSKAESEFQGVQLNMPILFTVLLLSGILWPVEALPEWIQPVSYALPTTWTAEAFRSIMIRGWGLESTVVLTAFAFDAVFAVVMLGIASRTLRVQE
ncbi:MAG: hypothetical protein CXX70_00870 [Methanobacteriota archaeon]|nr:MAG: hypothetical protein CXX70_00870 [Euryarchaeota archaeon]